MAYPKIKARAIRRSEIEDEQDGTLRRVVTLRLTSPYPLTPTYGVGSLIDVPAECLTQDVMVGDEFEIDFFHVRRPKEAKDAAGL